MTHPLHQFYLGIVHDSPKDIGSRGMKYPVLVSPDDEAGRTGTCQQGFHGGAKGAAKLGENVGIDLLVIQGFLNQHFFYGQGYKGRGCKHEIYQPVIVFNGSGNQRIGFPLV